MEQLNIKLAIVSTFTPRQCGLATFTNSLIEVFEYYIDRQVKIVAIDDDNYSYSPRVISKIDQNDKKSYIKAANFLNSSDIELIALQHEYGIFGGKNGSYILDFLQNINKPIVTSFHSVLRNHDPHRQKITQQIINYSNSIIVMTKTAKDILTQTMRVDPQKIFIVKHGVPNVRFDEKEKTKKYLGYENKTILSTFGLLGPGKGIDLAINAMAEVVKINENVIYLVLGATHPAVVKRDGEKYRKSLIGQVKKLKLEKNILFIDHYLSYPDLVSFLKATDIYLSTNLDLNQAFSGTLSYALGCGCAIIAGPTVYAKEMLADSRGIIIDLTAQNIANEIVRLTKSEETLRKLKLKAYRYGRSMVWSSTGLKYLQVVESNLFIKNDGWIHRLPDFKEHPPVKHFFSITDDFGIFQHCNNCIPNKDFGYSLDDQARGMIVSQSLSDIYNDPKMKQITLVYLNFLKKAVDKNLVIHNFFNDEKKHIDDFASDDSIARSFWALCNLRNSKKLSFKAMIICQELVKIYETKLNFDHLRPISYALIGFSKIRNKNQIKKLADKIINLFEKNDEENWHWFEKDLSWANAIPIIALIKSYRVLKNKNYYKTALVALDFLEKNYQRAGYPSPVGQKKWYKKDKTKSIYDQQPIEAADMVMLYNELFDITGEKKYKDKALQWFGWYFGNNIQNTMIYNPLTQGVYDGLTKKGPNTNQGAESIVTFLMAYLSFNKQI